MGESRDRGPTARGDRVAPARSAARPRGERCILQHLASSVLVVGGDPATRMMLHFLLDDAGCAVTELAQIGVLDAPERADLLVVADGAHQDGVEVVAALHRAGYRGPVVLLSHGIGSSVRHRAAMLGVLEIIGLPAAPRDLQMRLQVHLNDSLRQAHPHAARANVLRAGDLTLRTAAREVSDGKGWTVKLSRLEVNLLRALMGNAGQTLTYQALLEHVWGEDYRGSDNALRIQVRRLREKLTHPAGRHSYIGTVRRQGYTFSTPQEEPCVLIGAKHPEVAARVPAR